MDLHGRPRNTSNPPPPSSTFRRIPVLGKASFRRDKTPGSDPPSSPPLESTLTGPPSSPSHQRVPTFPSLAADNLGALIPSGQPKPSKFPPHLPFPSSRTSSLPSSPAPPTEPSSILVTPRYAPSSAFPLGPTQRDNMTTAPPIPGPPDFDLEPITYPAHLAQTKPPESSASTPGRITDRMRDYTMGSIPTALGSASPSMKHDPNGYAMRKHTAATPTAPDSSGRTTRPLPRMTPENTSQDSVRRVTPTDAATAGSSRDDSEYASRRRPSHAHVPSNPPSAAPQSSNDASTVREKTSQQATSKTSVSKRTVTPKLPSAPVKRAPTTAMYFSSLPVHGKPPEQALRAHTGTLVGDRIWFIGGVDGKNCWRGVAYFDTETLFWSSVETFGEVLPPLRAHTTTLVGTDLYIFGGGDGPTYSNDVWVFDTVTHRFSRPPIASSSSSLPPPRRAHTAILYKHYLVVFGGGNGQAALNDIWALDISDPAHLTWHEWKTTGDRPQKKGYHTANLVGNKMVVFGGSDGHASFADVHILSLETLVWTLITTDVTNNRLSHTSTQVGSYLFIIGGHNGQSYAQDVLLFNLVTLQWESKTPAGLAPPGRGYHVSLLHDGRIFISGGYNGVAVFDDLWVLDLSAGAYLPQVTTFDIDETAESFRRDTSITA